MKKISLALGTAAVLAFTAIAGTAQAQPHPHHGDRGFHRPHVYVPPPPPRHFHQRHGHYDHRSEYRGGPRHYAYRDNDRDGVPNRYDSRPNNPYRR